MSVKPTLILLPGLDGTGELFAPLQAALGDGVNTLAVRYHSETRFEQYVNTVMAQLPERDAVLVAESFSGPIAMEIMACYPKRIRCAILSATFAVGPFRRLCAMAGFIPPVLFQPGPLRRSLIRYFSLNGETEHDIIDKVMEVLHEVPSHITRSRLTLLSEMDMRQSLPRITMPVLYLQAKHDRIVKKTLYGQVKADLPSVAVRQIDGPHMLLQTRPEECAEAIAAFLELYRAG
ncbi:MAG: alpha/beta hydrolase [Pseudohongiellaceae bacterium]